MGSRWHPGRHRALISRNRAGYDQPTGESAARLLAEPAEYDWTESSAAQRPLNDPAEDWPAGPPVYQWRGGWTDQPAERRLLDDLAEPGRAREYPRSAGPAASARSAGAGADQPMPGQRSRRQTARLSGTTQQDWYLALAPYRWYLAISAVAAAVALASAVILLLAH